MPTPQKPMAIKLPDINTLDREEAGRVSVRKPTIAGRNTARQAQPYRMKPLCNGWNPAIGDILYNDFKDITEVTKMARSRQLGLRLDEFIDSVERGWHELRSGLGEVVAENDDFFDSIRKELKTVEIKEKPAPCPRN